jgi:hypothetical protein
MSWYGKICTTRLLCMNHLFTVQKLIGLFWEKMSMVPSKIALFCYQTIPFEILHQIGHAWREIADSPKMTLMHPVLCSFFHPFCFLHCFLCVLSLSSCSCTRIVEMGCLMNSIPSHSSCTWPRASAEHIYTCGLGEIVRIGSGRKTREMVETWEQEYDVWIP